MGTFIDLTGRRFDRLTVLSRGPNKGVKAVWLCRCDCGQLALAHGHDLRLGKHRSCGCLHRERTTTHGDSTAANNYRSPEYRAWLAMKARCYNPRTRRFDRYGGRGIAVCDRWRDSFAAFLADMGRKPTPSHSVDRIDNDGNYEPANCRWATRAEQQRNNNRTHHLTHQGRTMCLQDWADELGIQPTTLRGRIAAGWPIERALQPV